MTSCFAMMTTKQSPIEIVHNALTPIQSVISGSELAAFNKLATAPITLRVAVTPTPAAFNASKNLVAIGFNDMGERLIQIQREIQSRSSPNVPSPADSDVTWRTADA